MLSDPSEFAPNLENLGKTFIKVQMWNEHGVGILETKVSTTTVYGAESEALAIEVFLAARNRMTPK